MSDAFDYLILGGGLAGCSLAARLADDPALQVALLEAGPAVDANTPGSKRRLDWAFTTEVQAGLNGRSVALPMTKRLGGCARWFAADVAGGDETHAPGPQQQQLLIAARQAGLEAEPELRDVAATPQALLERPNLRVITDAHVMRILLEGSRQHLRAVGVEYAHEGYQKQLRAGREVVLCAGALQSPQILMLSGIGPHAHLVENGIGTRLPLPGVGRLLIDLPQIALHVVPAERQGVMGLARRLGSVVVRQGAKTRMRMDGAAEAGMFIRSGPEVRDADLRVGLAGSAGAGYALQIRLLHAESRGQLRLDSKDPFAAPLIDPNLLGHREDMERLLRGVRLVRSLLAQPAMAAPGHGEAPASARAQNDLQLEHFIRDHALPAGFPAGSCAMGKGTTDVVDNTLRVHGVAGLRVVDASVLAEPVADNGQASLLALTEKAAELLRAAARAAPP